MTGVRNECAECGRTFVDTVKWPDGAICLTCEYGPGYKVKIEPGPHGGCVPPAPPLFDAAPADGSLHMCQACPASAWMTVDGLRVLGWLAFDGTSLAGQPLHVRICPACATATRPASHGSATTQPPLVPHSG